MQSKLSDAVDELRNALRNFNSTNQNIYFNIHLYGMNSVTGVWYAKSF